ncbi:MAG: hypothetical protein ACJ8AI_18775 [Rhodopila sp.]
MAADDVTLEALTEALPVFLPDHRVLALPAWDALPYDHARPSRRVTGTRVASLSWLAETHAQTAVVVTTPEALVQRIPPADRLADRAVTLAVDDEVDPAWLHATLEAFGYVFDERVDEPGEAAIRPGAVDIHPAGANTPVRLELDAGRIVSIRLFDPLSQRSDADAGPIRLLPASEAFTVPGETMRTERLLPEGPLSSLFELLPRATIAAMAGVDERIDDWLALVRDSYVLARNTSLPPPDALFLPGADLGHAPRFVVDESEDESALPLAAAARRAAALSKDGTAVALGVPAVPERARTVLARRLGVPVETIALLATWRDAEALAAGRIGVLHLSIREGFRLPGRVVLAVRDTSGEAAGEAAALEQLASEPRIGDMVIEPDRGLAQLIGLAMAESDVEQECLSLEFLGGQRLLLPAFEAGRIWRYGASGTVSPDRLTGATWPQRRAEAEQAVAAAARMLVERLQGRARRTAPVIGADADYQRFIRRMPYTAGSDQTRAIRSVRNDLAAGRPMQRLVCGDVGFGKTEVALHAVPWLPSPAIRWRWWRRPASSRASI